jgi:hypothetical protein
MQFLKFLSTFVFNSPQLPHIWNSITDTSNLKPKGRVKRELDWSLINLKGTEKVDE